MKTEQDEQDALYLQQQGYKQELTRSWGLLQNFGSSFSIISVITGLSTLFSYGLNSGGPAVMLAGWIFVSVLTILGVALGMAEITSAHPNAGGPYYWSALLAPRRQSAFWAWVTGWFNFVGQFAVTTGITFGLAGLIATTATVQNPTFVPTPGKILGIYAALLVSHIAIISLGIKVLKYLNNLSILLHSLGVFAIATATVAAAPTHRTNSQVWGDFYDGTGWSERASPAYVCIIGILMSQFTITGFDASAHLSEETSNAARNAPLGVISSVAISAVFGFYYLLCMLYSIQDFDATVDSEYGQPILQILVDIFGTRGGVALFSIAMCCVYMCGLFSLTSNSRMAYAFARDGALPRIFQGVTSNGTPFRTLLLMAFLAFILALPSLGSSVAYAAATSIATIGLYISYVIPITLGGIYQQQFKAQKGPFNLGRFSRPVSLLATVYVAFITIAFCLPNATPITSQTLNYTPVCVGIVLLWIFGTWFLFARKWFEGPLRSVEQAEAQGKSFDPVKAAMEENLNEGMMLFYGLYSTMNMVTSCYYHPLLLLVW